MIPAAYLVIDRPPLDDIETAIKETGFDPAMPPNRLRGPGVIYAVEYGSYQKVCDADPALIASKLKSSPAPDRHRESLEKAGFSLSGRIVDAVNTGLNGARLTSVEYTLTNVTISEIDYGDLFAIEDKLLRQKNCEKAVQPLLEAHQKIFPGYAALSATTSYKVHVRSELRSNAADKMLVLDAVQKTLQESADGQIRIQSGDELTGENLLYGIQFSRRCITAQDASEPSVLPQSTAQQAPAHIEGL
jgi:hypothetical protein